MRVVVGDTIQWESQGIHFFKEPRLVKEVHTHDGEKFVVVEDGPTGIPAKQVRVINRCLEHYGDGKWTCARCNESWASTLLHKHQVPIPCYCPHCRSKLTFMLAPTASKTSRTHGDAQ